MNVGKIELDCQIKTVAVARDIVWNEVEVGKEGFRRVEIGRKLVNLEMGGREF